MSNGKDEFHRYLEETMKNMRPFKPGLPWFNPEGNGIHLYWEDVPSYGTEVGEVTLHKAQDDDRIVGVTIHGVRELVEETKITQEPAKGGDA